MTTNWRPISEAPSRGLILAGGWWMGREWLMQEATKQDAIGMDYTHYLPDYKPLPRKPKSWAKWWKNEETRSTEAALLWGTEPKA
jgi:hypothetical protein